MSTMARIETLLATDQCDRCPARAMVEYELESGGRLRFCAHHGAAIPEEVKSHWRIVAAGNF